MTDDKVVLALTQIYDSLGPSPAVRLDETKLTQYSDTLLMADMTGHLKVHVSRRHQDDATTQRKSHAVAWVHTRRDVGHGSYVNRSEQTTQ